MSEKQHSDDLIEKGMNETFDFSDIVDDGDIDDEDLTDDVEMTAEEEAAFYRALRRSLEMEAMKDSQQGNQKKPHQFSEQYESRLKDSLTKMFGKEDAEEILEYRRLAREESAEIASELMPAQERISEQIHEKDGRLSQFRRKSDAVHRKEKKAVYKRTGWYQKSLVKAAAACLCIVILGGVVSMNVDALRVPIARFFSEKQPTYTILNAEPETENERDAEAYPDTIEKRFALSKVLEGYEEVDRESVSKMVRIVYENSEGLNYQFVQETRDTNTWLDNEGVDWKKEDTLFGNAFYYRKDNEYKLVWSYEGYVFQISGDLTEKEMVDLANSLRMEK
ncbi:MAG: DUF4367 domain-containing protein [Lachnospiraceae bacterium]|nr:DUF4367 domain-containing protein [Lachnospiraceae bacterium]